MLCCCGCELGESCLEQGDDGGVVLGCEHERRSALAISRYNTRASPSSEKIAHDSNMSQLSGLVKSSAVIVNDMKDASPSQSVQGIHNSLVTLDLFCRR